MSVEISTADAAWAGCPARRDGQPEELPEGHTWTFARQGHGHTWTAFASR